MNYFRKDETLLDYLGDNNYSHINHLSYLHRYIFYLINLIINYLFNNFSGSRVIYGRSTEDDEFGNAMKNTLVTRGDGGTGK
jgi:hypothetical protein